jgi:hypothetical protein
MRIILFTALLVFISSAQASTSLRVGNRVLSAGDSAERVTELLGKPSSRTHKHAARSHGGGKRGRHGKGRTLSASSNEQPAEQWRYRRDGHSTVVTLVDGKVTNIEDRRL